MRVRLLLLVLFIFTLVSSISTAVIVDSNNQFKVKNITYKAYSSLKLNKIEISDDYVLFNKTTFKIKSANSITISIVNLKEDVANAENGDLVIDFYAICSSGKVWFNISGFPAGNGYTIKVGGVTVGTASANLSSYISFSYNSWSTKRFQLYQFEKCPLWDINIDRLCNIVDLVIVSNKMDMQGDYREDVDRNGKVQVLDMVIVSNNYGKIW